MANCTPLMNTLASEWALTIIDLKIMCRNVRNYHLTLWSLENAIAPRYRCGLLPNYLYPPMFAGKIRDHCATLGIWECQTPRTDLQCSILFIYVADLGGNCMSIASLDLHASKSTSTIVNERRGKRCISDIIRRVQKCVAELGPCHNFEIDHMQVSDNSQ